MCYAGDWRDFCADYFSESLANVVCRQLGFCDEGGDVTYFIVLRSTLCIGIEATSYLPYNDIYIRRARCNGMESELSSCDYLLIGVSDCSNATFVDCGPKR